MLEVPVAVGGGVTIIDESASGDDDEGDGWDTSSGESFVWEADGGKQNDMAWFYQSSLSGWEAYSELRRIDRKHSGHSTFRRSHLVLLTNLPDDYDEYYILHMIKDAG